MSALPRFVEPQLATLVKKVPDGNEWLHELKFDGYRMLGRLDQGHVELLSRRARAWSTEFPTITDALGLLHARTALVDGEVAAFLPDGSTSFQALQNAGSVGAVLGFALFDLLYVDGEDLRHLPLEQRKERLRALVASSTLAAPTIRFVDHIVGRGPEVWEKVCADGKLEGIVSKRRTSTYVSGRTTDWLKTKCLQLGEFVVGGFTEPWNGRGLRGLLVGTYVRDQLVFAGRVGTGITERQRKALFEFLDQRRIEQPPFAPFAGDSPMPPPSRWTRASSRASRPVWVHPELVVEVEFREWTEGDVLRHPSLEAVLPDRRPHEVHRR